MRDVLKSNYHWVTLFALVFLVGLVDRNFWNIASLLILIGDVVPLFIMALGLTFAIYIGGIDLSTQSMANMVTVIASLYLTSLGFLIVPLCILIGACLGGLSGFITTRFLVPSFISTLAIGGYAIRWRNGCLEIARCIWTQRREISFLVGCLTVLVLYPMHCLLVPLFLR